MRTYSAFFQTLHDETGPTGDLGRGTHYSVFRAVAFHDAQGSPLPQGRLLDFAVIWDEDHDDRVFEAIERIYMAGLLSAFCIVGERKGTFTAILADDACAPARQSALAKAVDKITQDLDSGDSWPAQVVDFSTAHGWIVHDREEKVRLYLANLRMLWNLGLKMPKRAATQDLVGVALEAVATYLRTADHVFVFSKVMPSPQEKQALRTKVSELADHAERLAANRTVSPAQFDALVEKVHVLGTSLPTELHSQVARAFTLKANPAAAF